MRSWVLATVLFAVLIGALACSSLMRRISGGPAAAADYGPHFDHAGHLKRGIECADCHGDEKDEWRKMPTYENCKECHDDLDKEAKPEKRASSFFDAEGKHGLWSPSRAINPEVNFPHGKHVLAKEKKCEACHAEVVASTGQSTSTYLDMDACIACHKREAPQNNQCETCHRELRIDRAPVTHHLGWKREHGRLVREGSLSPDELPKDCSICHKRSDCDMCHRAEAPANHTNFFRLRGHATMASFDRDRCRVCHTTDSCFMCHQNTKPRNHTGTWGAPFDRHCYGCHLPLQSFDDQGCFVCHKTTPGHASAPPKPNNPVHMTNDPNQCRVCHMPGNNLHHPDNGDSCLLCHH